MEYIYMRIKIRQKKDSYPPSSCQPYTHLSTQFHAWRDIFQLFYTTFLIPLTNQNNRFTTNAMPRIMQPCAKENSAFYYSSPKIFPREDLWGLFCTCILDTNNSNNEHFSFTPINSRFQWGTNLVRPDYQQSKQTHEYVTR